MKPLFMNIHILRSMAVVLFTLMLTFPMTSHAVSSCKGKSKSSCSSDNRCSWVNSYTNKNGNKVGAFCRAKPGKRKSSNAAKASSTSAKSSSTIGRKADKTAKKTNTKKTKQASSKSTSKNKNAGKKSKKSKSETKKSGKKTSKKKSSK